MQPINKYDIKFQMFDFKSPSKEVVEEGVASHFEGCLVDVTFAARVHGHLDIRLNFIEVISGISHSYFKIALLFRHLEKSVDNMISCVASTLHRTAGLGAGLIQILERRIVALDRIFGEWNSHVVMIESQIDVL
jgi:hypothetical protein